MPSSCAKLLLVVMLGQVCYAQNPPTTNNPPTPPQQNTKPNPAPVPSPPDLAIPDPGTLSSPPKHKSGVKRVLERAAPNCLDFIFHTCWSSPPAPADSVLSEGEREFEKDIDVGDFHLKNKNYRGAEFRFRDALRYRPEDPEVTYKLALSLDKLHRRDEAREAYDAYLKLAPDGCFAAQAKDAVKDLQAPKKN